MKYFMYYTFVKTSGTMGDGHTSLSIDKELTMETIGSFEEEMKGRLDATSLVVNNFIKLSG